MTQSNDEQNVKSAKGGASLLQQVTPLARQINCLDMDCIGRVCVESIPPLVGMRFASVYLLDNGGHILHLLNHNHPFPINRIVSLNQTPPSPMIMAVKSSELVVIGDIDHHRRPTIRRSQRMFAGNYETGNCIITPLVCQNRVVGVLNLADRFHGTFEPNLIAVIELLGQLLGASVGNIKLFERMQRQATTDGLTGLANHRTFYETLERELWRSRRFGGKLALIMVDVDNLKTINDTYGHRAGDKVIEEVSRRITHCVRQVDTAARYGGDEFAIILPNTRLKDALRVGERMVARVANSPIGWEKGRIELSVSVGVGEYEAEASPEEIMRNSDKALYAAKESGKNTVRVFNQISPS
ncbi:diguanylate cyclase [Planctomycetota bacterium]